MHLPRAGREYYRLVITTNPPVAPSAWEASFDAGATWTAAVDRDGASAWLVRGPDAPEDQPAALVTAKTEPIVRLVDNPEIVLRRAPDIYLGME